MTSQYRQRRRFMKTIKSLTYSRQLTISILLIGTLACTDTTQLSSVDDTQPSSDERILNSATSMSDGAPIAPHKTTTLQTSIELASDGLIGGITIDQEGNIYTADLGSHIWKIKPNGETMLLSSEFEDPSGILALDNGDLLQSEWTNNRIYKISPNGSRTLFSETNLNGPVGIAQLADGDFIVANSRGKFLARIPQAGGDAEIVLQDTRMTQPNGVTVDPEGNVYIADLDSGNVFKWRPGSQLTSLVELPGKGNSHNVFANGMLYVNKIWDHVVYIVNPKTGAYGIVSGTGVPGYKDGITGIATLEEPNAIGASKDGKTIYINTHRGTMGRGMAARIIVRKLQ